MRLRYLRVRNNPPLEDVSITFHHETALGRECAIQFIVGVNGSGKSRLLQVIAEIFLSLARQSVPSYPITLAYDIGTETNRRTILLRHVGGSISNALMIEYMHTLTGEEIDWDSLHESHENERIRYSGKELPGSGSMSAYLPSALLAYTSGATDSWERLFTPRTEHDEDAIRETLSRTDIEEHARGTHLYRTPSQAERASQPSPPGENISEALPASFLSTPILFLSPKDLELGLFAVALDHAVKEFHELQTEPQEKAFIERIDESIRYGKRMPGLRGILNAVDWLWPVTASMRIAWRREDFSGSQVDQVKREKLAQLYQIASAALRGPEPFSRLHLHFDLRRPLDNNITAAELMSILGGPTPTPFSVFSQLRSWRREGFLKDVTMIVRKRNIDDLLLYEWLSDGEKVFLGRMALFHLLGGRNDALLLLDEPETHFNDIWKREIVDIIDESLGSVTSNVVITTHSSIALTDVFDTEISVLEKIEDGSVLADSPSMKSFGASPNEIMRGIFGAPDSVGQRAAQFLDLVLTLASNPEDVERVWAINGNNEDVRNSEAFKRLWSSMGTLPHNYQNDESLLITLRAFRAYAQQKLGATDVSVVEALEVLRKRIGPGYYEFEFHRRLREIGG